MSKGNSTSRAGLEWKQDENLEWKQDENVEWKQEENPEWKQDEGENPDEKQHEMWVWRRRHLVEPSVCGRWRKF
jgi:hypothetical protein